MSWLSWWSTKQIGFVETMEQMKTTALEIDVRSANGVMFAHRSTNETLTLCTFPHVNIAAFRDAAGRPKGYSCNTDPCLAVWGLPSYCAQKHAWKLY